MMQLTAADFKAMFRKISTRIEGERNHLCELDGHIGDADHGIAMEQGFGAIVKALDTLAVDPATPTDVFNTAAKSFLNAVGASSGPLYATAFLRAGAAFKGKDSVDLDEAPYVIEAMARGIDDRRLEACRNRRGAGARGRTAGEGRAVGGAQGGGGWSGGDQGDGRQQRPFLAPRRAVARPCRSGRGLCGHHRGGNLRISRPIDLGVIAKAFHRIVFPRIGLPRKRAARTTLYALPPAIEL
jgi:hypothetical protein